MRIRVAAFTRRALELARRIAAELAQSGDVVDLYATSRLAGEDVHALDDLQSFAESGFAETDALLFVSAAGIATRAIAPCVASKFRDPAVVCVDESGAFVIPLLSGHVGGANKLARRVAAITGGVATVTTATDVQGLFAVDEWAGSQGLALVEPSEAKRVSAALLEGEAVGFASAWPVAGPLPQGLVGEGEEPRPVVGICVGLDTEARPFAHTLHLVPRCVTVGVGCKRGTSAERIDDLVGRALAQAGVAPAAVGRLASIDLKWDEAGLHELAARSGWDLRFHSADQLAEVPGDFHSSAFVERTVGVDNVCERAACAAGERLLLGRVAQGGVTVAVACAEPSLSFDERKPVDKVLVCVGLGPGAGADLTLRARAALESAQVIVGYRTYVDLIRKDFPQAEYVVTGMRGEVDRCRAALERAGAGQRVAVVCSGDPGVYAMAGLLFELAPDYPGVQVRVVPGVTAANGGAAVLGAPLMHDWCSVSLSDLMTPWEAIEARLRAAAEADFCIALYNPASRGRADHLRRACDVLLEHRSPDTVCGIVRNVGRQGQESRVTTLADLRDAQVDMVTCVFVGNSNTKDVGGRMVTPRGYLQREA